MFHWFDSLTNTRGDSLVGWQVECVQVSDGTTVVPIFADESSTPIANVSGVTNRAVTDADGNYDFFVPSGTYSLRIYNSGGVFQRLQRYLPMYGADFTEGVNVLVSRTEPPASPVAAVNVAAGNLNGTYRYRITYVTADGETEGSGESNAVSPANQQVDLTIPTGPSEVTARKIYRNPAAAVDTVLMQLVATISDNSTTSYTDNIADGSLGAAIPYFNSTGGNLEVNGVTFGSVSDLNTRLGQASYPNQTGYANTTYGAASMRAMTTGSRCTAVGVFALDGNTTGINNTGVGVHALNDNATGSANVAVGLNALFKTTSSSNVAIGSNALAENVLGNSNTAIGEAAGQLRTGGDNNVIVGQRACFAAGNGSSNTVVGREAGLSFTTAGLNTLVGAIAGDAITTANACSALGYNALGGLTTGSSNTAFGANAGASLTTGAANIFFGENAGNNASQKVDAFRSIALGFGAFNDKDDQIVLGHPEATETILRGVLRANATYTLATIPLSAAAAGAGARTFITDSTVTASGNFGAIVAGGGANAVPLYSDGTDWRIG